MKGNLHAVQTHCETRFAKIVLCRDFEEQDKQTNKGLVALNSLAKIYDTQLSKEEETQLDKRDVEKVGHLDARKRLEDVSNEMLSQNIVQAMTAMLDTIVFWVQREKVCKGQPHYLRITLDCLLLASYAQMGPLFFTFMLTC